MKQSGYAGMLFIAMVIFLAYSTNAFCDDSLFIDGNGNVGIGTSSPSGCALNIVRPDDSRIILQDSGDDSKLALRSDGSNSEIGTWSNHGLRFTTNGLERLRISASGNIGIGTTAPAEELTVSKSQAGSTAIEIENEKYNDLSADVALLFTQSLWKDSIAKIVGVRRGSHNENINTRSQALAFYTSMAGETYERMRIDYDGKVYIGTSSPGAKLDVAGQVQAECFIATDPGDGWCDYVFEENYELQPLEDVESFIIKNKHLPEIPSENEVRKNGINMTDMLKKQMKKIEELTLYMIQMKKENETLKARLSALENEGKEI